MKDKEFLEMNEFVPGFQSSRFQIPRFPASPLPCCSQPIVTSLSLPLQDLVQWYPPYFALNPGREIKYPQYLLFENVVS